MKVKALFALLTVFVVAASAHAEPIYRIEIGRDYKEYSPSDLQRRVWELERAVWQLQQRVFQLEAGKPAPVAESWICRIDAMGNAYTGIGATKAVATAKAIDSCKAGRGGDAFFCSNPKCEQ